MFYVLEGVESRFDPARTVLLEFLVQTGVEAGEAGVAPSHHDVLQIVLTKGLICEAEGLEQCAGDPTLLQTYVLRVEEYFWYLEAFFVEGNVLGVHAWVGWVVL